MRSLPKKYAAIFAGAVAGSLAVDLARENSTIFLPTFGDYLGSIGIDHADITQETAYPVYVNDTARNDPLRLLYRLVEDPIDNPYSYLSVNPRKGTCTITLQGNPFKDHAIPLNGRDSHLVSFFHEYRHCQPANIAMPYPLKEADADYYAITMTLNFNASATVPDALLHARALRDHDFDHETALYLDAWLNNTPEPAHDDVIRAARQFVTMTNKAAMTRLRTEASCYPHNDTQLRIVARLRAGNDERLIAETHHRIALYLDAQRREDPALYAGAKVLLAQMETPCLG